MTRFLRIALLALTFAAAGAPVVAAPAIAGNVSCVGSRC
jgi:hypothetical protein